MNADVTIELTAPSDASSGSLPQIRIEDARVVAGEEIDTPVVEVSAKGRRDLFQLARFLRSARG